MSPMQIRKQVISVMREVLSDPDMGRALTPYAKRRLAASARSKTAGRTRSLKTVLAKYSSR